MPESTTTAESPSFSEFLETIEDGNLHADLTEELTQLVSAINNQFRAQGGKPKGKLTLDLTFMLDGGVFELRADIKTKLPRLARPRSLFYSTRDNHLSVNNPRQLELGMKPVDVSSTAVADIRSARRQ